MERRQKHLFTNLPLFGFFSNQVAARFCPQIPFHGPRKMNDGVDTITPCTIIDPGGQFNDTNAPRVVAGDHAQEGAQGFTRARKRKGVPSQRKLHGELAAEVWFEMGHNSVTCYYYPQRYCWVFFSHS